MGQKLNNRYLVLCRVGQSGERWGPKSLELCSLCYRILRYSLTLSTSYPHFHQSYPHLGETRRAELLRRRPEPEKFSGGRGPVAPAPKIFLASMHKRARIIRLRGKRFESTKVLYGRSTKVPVPKYCTYSTKVPVRRYCTDGVSGYFGHSTFVLYVQYVRTSRVGTIVCTVRIGRTGYARHIPARVSYFTWQNTFVLPAKYQSTCNKVRRYRDHCTCTYT